ncbi:hypothetical protein ACOI1C_02300 [Bacillus sp. DJP31]|uniref:hypothetical protein n=1 Tax=Bacillus sp. DJP31 TaxID=3409789 RepID=UPI003BB61106
MEKRILVTLCSFLLLTSCQFGNRENDPRLLTLLEADALYISNEENSKTENEYYNALLEIKKLYPGEMEEILVLSHHDIKNIKEELKIQTYPTLLLIDQKKIIAKIEGENEKDSIISKMTMVISEQ